MIARSMLYVVLLALLGPGVAWSVVEAPPASRSVVADANRVLVRTCYAVLVPGLTPEVPAIAKLISKFSAEFQKQAEGEGLAVTVREGCREDDDPKDSIVAVVLLSFVESPGVPGERMMSSGIMLKPPGESNMVPIWSLAGGSPPAGGLQDIAALMVKALVEEVRKIRPDMVRPPASPPSFAPPPADLADPAKAPPTNLRLTLPMTKRVVLKGCYDGKESEKAYLPHEVDGFSMTFIAEIKRAGFKDATLAECNKEDDPDGGITVVAVFSTIPRTSGKGVKKVIEVFLKAPRESRWVPVQRMEESESGPVSAIQSIAPTLAKFAVEAIKEAQSKGAIPRHEPTP